MTPFTLEREEDETGVSGTGTVADGVIFPNGTVAMCWRGELSSMVFYTSIAHVEKIHGHNGKTKVMLQ